MTQKIALAKSSYYVKRPYTYTLQETLTPAGKIIRKITGVNSITADH